MRSALVLAAPLALAVAACTGIIGLPDVPDLALADADTSDGAILSDATTRDATSGDATKPDADLDAGTDSGEGGTNVPRSCAGTGTGIDDCGPDGGSCCESVLVDSKTKTFNRNFGPGVDPPSAPAMVSDFRLDKYEVSVARFRAFVAAVQANPPYVPQLGSGKHSHIKDGTGNAVGLSLAEGGTEKGWQASSFSIAEFLKASTDEARTDGGHTPKSTYVTSAVEKNDRRPVNMVNWEEAYAFCIWDGGFLPTEAEWIFAAANGTEQRPWPWVGAPQASNAGPEYAILNFNYPPPNTKSTSNTLAQIAPVGVSVKGASAFGQYDMAGNMHELVLDRPSSTGFPSNSGGSCVDCTTLNGTQTIVRGGNYGDPPDPKTGNTVRDFVAIGDRRDYQGFRCARSPL